ncbi:kinase-like protein [Cylindrobasidium torrendii FP15055 ss-10]|uniref:Kinase-like protein n=1 Tax=Cylindrobasidium torrendii FP15055 ss-10 TaxID=1314674 RepID=A0A0D7BK46_9AGAR|nr:kinase-like protein [Cylindrobasidium torrendii FP15055 ss-10]
MANAPLGTTDLAPASTRAYKIVKQLANHSGGSVTLCDWQSPETLPPNAPLPVMQTGPGARAEWQAMRLVAVKTLVRSFPGGWAEACRQHRELKNVLDIPPHPNIVEFYDAFVDSRTGLLYMVFEPMEGNLHTLLKVRKGKPFTDGLACILFSQMVAALGHLHSLDIVHCHITPENILVTTTGLFDYRSGPLPPSEPQHASQEGTTTSDIVAIVKLCDFAQACSMPTQTADPDTKVGTRWYRAPELLLNGPKYSLPIDMWALGCVMAECLLLKPLFPGTSQTDMLMRIIALMGDPGDTYGLDSNGDPIGGGTWDEGVELASQWGVTLPRVQPRDLHTFFGARVPTALVQCIGQLLRYDPTERLTALECLNHTYFREILTLNDIPDLSAPHLFSANSDMRKL